MKAIRSSEMIDKWCVFSLLCLACMRRVPRVFIYSRTEQLLSGSLTHMRTKLFYPDVTASVSLDSCFFLRVFPYLVLPTPR